MDPTSFDPQALMQTGGEMITQWGLRVIGAVLLLVVGRWIAKRIRRGVQSMLNRAEFDPTLVPFLSAMAYWLALAVVVIAVLNAFGVQTASLVAVLGAAGLAIGLALQGTLSNLAAGVMLLVFRPFKVGDFIDAGGTTGTVQEIGLFSTRLHTPDNIRIIVPNSGVFGGTIKNFSANDTRRIDLVMGISYGDDIGVARDTMLQVLNEESRVLKDPEPVVEVAELADSSVNLVVRPWVATEDYWAVRFHLTRVLKERLEAAGCNIPFPQRDVHLFKAAD
jgi:small conductance mechanosensitive channel